MKTQTPLTSSVLVLTSSLALAAVRPSFDIPDTICAAPGLECNVYFGDVVDTVRINNFAYETRGKVGRCENARWTWTPKKEDAGRREPIEFLAWSDAGVAFAKTVTVEVAKAPADTTRKVTCALLGDSATNCRFQDRILAAMREQGWTNYTPVGSRSGSSAELWGVFKEGEAAHDGYGGYTVWSFLTTYSMTLDEIDNLQSEQEREQLQRFGTKLDKGNEWRKGLLKSPLVQIKNGKKVVDVQAWFDRINGGQAPDVIFIELGGNGGCIQRDEQIARHLVGVTNTCRKLIAELRKAAPKSVIGLATLAPGDASQDAFSAYGNDISAVQCHKNFHAINRRYAELVDEMNAEGDKNIRLVPVGQSIHPVYGYVRYPTKPFVHSKETYPKPGNALHATLEGGKQLGDAYAAWLLVELGNGRL